MYYVSYLINNNADSDQHEIYIIDGQNQTQIEEYKQLNNTYPWNPCIAMPFDDTKSITINFNTNDWRNWYPNNTCDYRNNSAFYDNTYLFDGGKSLTVNDLNINDYEIDNNTNYPIIRSMDNYNASITIKDCIFTNITSSMTTSLVSSKSSIYMKNNSFINIKSFGSMFYGYH